MYRLLTFRPAAVQNIKRALGGGAEGFAGSSAVRAATCNFCGCGLTGRPLYNHLLKQRMPVLLDTGGRVMTKTPAQITTSNNTSPFRHQSTTTTKAERVPKKRKKHVKRSHYTKYLDLLEVTDLAVKERKSRIKRLKAKKLQEFICKTKAHVMQKLADKRERARILKATTPATAAASTPSKPQPIEYQQNGLEALDTSALEIGPYDDKPLIFFGKEEHTKRLISNPLEVHKILKSYNNFRDIIEAMEQEVQETETALNPYSSATSNLNETEDPLESIGPYLLPDVIEQREVKKKAATQKTKPRFKTKVHSNEEQERLCKERALLINLNTYLNVCVSAGMLNRAHSTILTYRQRSKKFKLFNNNIMTADLYNILLHGYAEKGSVQRIQEVLTLMEEDQVRANEKTFAAVFECLGRLEPSQDNTTDIKKYIEMAGDMGFTLNQIMDRSKFISDQRDIALDAIQRVQPTFIPIYTPPPLGYENSLLNELNANVLPADVPCNEANTIGPGSEIMNSKRGFNKDQLEQMARDQLKIELDGSITIKSIEKEKDFKNLKYCRRKLKEVESQWRTNICDAITRDLNTLRTQVRFKPHGYMNYYTYLNSLDAKQYADILVKEIYKLAEASETFSPTIGQLYKELGEKVQHRHHIEQKKKNGILEKTGEIYGAYCKVWDTAQSSDNPRQIWQRLVHEQRTSGPSMDLRELAWPPNVLMGVGRFLYNILMRDIKIDTHIMRQTAKTKNILPAFYTLFRNHGRMVKEEVKPHPVLARLLRASRLQTLTFDSNIVPMLCPPQPWSTPYNGGYLLNKSELIRLPHQAIQQWERINASNPQHLYPSLDSLNQLASIPWRVNTDVLDVITSVFQNGGDQKLDVPQPPSSLPPLPVLPTKDDSISNTERAKLFKEKMVHRRMQAEMYSLWCDTLYRLSLAQHYRDKVFWLPHNMDFRGRVYPVPPHLNHLGSDLARSMLIFDQAQPLGPDGFSWLKLHCINLTGQKKRNSVRERLLYAEQIMDEILDSAHKPLTGGMWWAKSEEPWQTLACCMEIAKVHESPNPEEYLSRFPIHQDGSCNGLQHYAALGRDKAGAFSVNLTPSTVPQDVYSAVAALVEKSRTSDAASGLEVAKALDGFVRRKVIKQTVMTTVYGVTRYGARLQIARQLKDIEGFPKDWVWPASTYLTSKTFESLREMFTSTREIQDWFTDCARLISSVCNQNVEWCTPLGLPVVQPYNRQETKNFTRSSLRVSETMSLDMYERPNVMKQKNAFPPNFIHSLDSSHMMLTSLHCERKGLTFVSVHDCFWTHACTVPDMNTICREQFVALHSQPILEDLSQFLNEKYSFKESDFCNDGSSQDLSKRQLNRVLRLLPQKGDFDLRNVLESVYFFS